MDKIVDHAQPQIGQGAHGQRHLLARKAVNELGVLDGTIDMIEPRDAKHVERFPDVARRAFLPGMGGEKEAGVARAPEDRLEFAGRMSAFGRIESDTGAWARSR